MKGFLKIYWNYIVTALVIFILLLIINFGIFMGYGIYNLQPEVMNKAGKFSFRAAADEMLVQEEGTWKISPSGQAFLEDNACVFLMLLSEQGEILYSWNLPQQLDRRYTLSDVASFTRWYLEDYPVYVWDTDGGVLVVGKEKGSTFKYNMVYSMRELNSLLSAVPFFLLWNLFLFLLILLFLGKRFYRSLCPISNGIEKLAQGKMIQIHTKGAVKDIGEKLNQASCILEKQRKEIERRDNARTEWISGVSHDIRTPLSMIMGYADSLENDANLTEENRQQAGIIKKQSLKIKNLIEDLNLTSKLTYQMQPLRNETYRPAAALRKILTSFLNRTGEENVSVSLEVDPRLEDCTAQGDVPLLERAVENLLNNSAAHNPKGCNIQIRAVKNGGKMEWEISDDGVGIPREVYLRLAGQKQDDGKVHIMGLYLVRQIITSHGGHFQINPNLHTIEIQLPLSCEKEQESAGK